MLVEGGKPAAFDITVTSPLCPAFLGEASRVAGTAALAAETRMHIANDKKCQGACVPIAVETYCNWGQEVKADILTIGISSGYCLITTKVLTVMRH